MKKHELPKLPYEYNALEPMISKETLEFHHDKHHKAYVDKLNMLVVGTAFEDASLETIVLKAQGSIFEQAAQVWNHSFYWTSMSPTRKPLNEKGELSAALMPAFGGSDQLRERFEQLGGSLFGSGWLWLVSNSKAELQFHLTKDAGNPLREGLTPLFVCDLWEHAYYIDYRNGRSKYISEFYKMIDWEFAEKNYAAVLRSL
jgi:superoxide dismutase, Fe-Mn family